MSDRDIPDDAVRDPGGTDTSFASYAPRIKSVDKSLASGNGRLSFIRDNWAAPPNDDKPPIERALAELKAQVATSQEHIATLEQLLRG